APSWHLARGTRLGAGSGSWTRRAAARRSASTRASLSTSSAGRSVSINSRSSSSGGRGTRPGAQLPEGAGPVPIERVTGLVAKRTASASAAGERCRENDDNDEGGNGRAGDQQSFHR